MNISVKKFSKKSLSLLIALIMVFSALPLTPPISADAAEVKTNIDVWDASRAGTNSNTGQYRYSYADSKTGKTLSGIQWNGLTHNSTYLTVNNSALSFAEINTTGVITGNDNIADLGIRGNKWSFSAKFAYTGSSTKTTVFGLSSTTKRNYTRSNDGGGTGLANGYVADLVDIRADGTVYINNTWSSTVSGISSADLVATSATAPKTLTVTYDNGNLTIDIDGTQKISQTVDTALFSAGVGNYLAGPNVQVFSGGTAPYYQVTNNSAYLWNFNLYSLSGATYVQEGSQPTPPTNKTVPVVGYGILKNTGKDNRASSNVLGIVNDQQDANFDIGFVNFDISSLSNSEFIVSSATYNMTYSIPSNESEAMGLSFYYATKNNSAFNLVQKPANFTNTTYDTEIFGSENQHIAKATSYLGLVNIGSVSTNRGATNASISIDLAPAIRYALKKGENRVQLLIMLKEAGGKSGQPWTDTQITVNQNDLSVNMMSNDEYVNTYIASRKTSYNVLDNSINNSGAYMSNIYSVDAWATSSDNSYYLETNKIASDKLRFNAFNVGVALYTGQGNIRFPVVLEKVAVSNPSGYDVYQNIEYTALNNGGLFRLGNDNNQWQYCNSTTNLTDATSGTGEGQVVTNFSNSTSAYKDSYQANGNDINYAKNDKFGTTTTKTFKNYITYTGTGNTSSYYDKLSSPTFSYRADYAVFWKDWNTWKLTNVHNKAFTLNSNFSCYVVNIKPLLEIVNGTDFTSNFSNIYNNSSKYNQSSLNNYYKVMADIVEFDLSKKRLTNEDEINSVASEIKDLVDRYNSYKSPELKKYTVTFYDVTGSAVVKTLTVTPGTTIDESDLPSTTSPTYYQNNQHRVYYWAYLDGTKFTVPYKVNDNVDIYESLKYEGCKFAVKSIVGNTSTVSCSVCNGGTYTLDIEAYKNIVSVAQEAINDEAKYDSDSRANLQTVLNNNTVNDCLTIEQVNAKISAIQTAINELVLNKYSITVNYVDENGKELAVGEEGATSKTYDAVDYGTIQNVVAPTNYNKVDYAVYKWTREDKSNSSISGLNSSSLDVVVKGASTYYVFLKKTSVDESQASGNAVITLNNKSNKVYDIGYVDLNENTPVSVSKNTITIGTVTLTAPNYSFYNITGFNINGKIITGTDTVSITKNTVIRPVYEAKQTVRITRASDDILINGNDIEFVDVDWNKKIVMTYNGAVPDGQVVIWKDGNGNVLAQGTTYSFYANSNVTISATVEASAPTDPTASIGFFSYDATDNKVTVVNNFYVPDGKTATKAGVILSTKNSTREALIAQTNGKFEGDESQFTTDKNQIRISVSRTANTSFTMYALAYVVVGDKTYYAPTVQSITYMVKNS